jgi:hypothetical protein
MQNVEIIEKLDSVLQMRTGGGQRHQRSITPTPSTHLERLNDHSSDSLTPNRQDAAQNIKEYLEETSRSGKNLCIVLKPIAEEGPTSDRDMVEVFPPQRRRRTSVLPSSKRSYSLRTRSVDKD